MGQADSTFACHVPDVWTFQASALVHAPKSCAFCLRGNLPAARA